MNNQWLEEVKRRLEAEASLPTGVRFDRLRELGIINERGEVTGHLHRWDAFLAITEVKRANGADKIAGFRCLKPVFGMPGDATIDIGRDSIVAYLKEGKKIITARKDERLDMWKQDREVHLTPNGFIRADSADVLADDVGTVPRDSDSIFTCP